MDKSLPVNDKTGEKVREEEGVIGSQHWEPRIRWDHGKLSVLLMFIAGPHSPHTHAPPIVWQNSPSLSLKLLLRRPFKRQFFTAAGRAHA